MEETEMNIPTEIKQFFDLNGNLRQIPSKYSRKVKAIKWLGDFFEEDRKYQGREINELINEHHTFNDSATLRRELIINKILSRSPDGRKYWKGIK